MSDYNLEYCKSYYQKNKERILESRKIRYQEQKANGIIKKNKERTLYLQRIRFHNPVVREKHRLACIKSKEKKMYVSKLAEIKTSEFDISFD